jgi:hypothetical protein
LHEPSESPREDRIGEHPRGTLFLVGVYGLLLLLGWLAVYVFVYVPRGVVTR